MTEKELPLYAIKIMKKYNVPSEKMEMVWKVINETSNSMIKELMSEREIQIEYMNSARHLVIDGFDSIGFMEKHNITAEELLKAWWNELDKLDVPVVIRLIDECDINVELFKRKLLQEYPGLRSEDWLIELCLHKMSCELLRFHSKFESIIKYYNEVTNGKE